MAGATPHREPTPPLQIGLLADLRNPAPWEKPGVQHVGRTLELIEEAERLGAAAVFLGEHHLTPDGYLPQPLTFAAAVAARTNRVRVGTSVVIAGLRHPLHIAEEAALVDLLSGGRLELGLGAGYVPGEFEAFGVERGDRFRLLDQAAAEVRRLLDEVVRPRPVQDPLPIWCGYFGAGARRAGLLGAGLLSLQRGCLDGYLDGLVAGGHDLATARMAGPLDLLVTADPERTRARAQPHLDQHAAGYARFQEQVAHAEGRAVRYVGTAAGENFKVLTPAETVAHIHHVTDGLPVAYVTPWLTLGGLPDDIVEEHLRLLLTGVAPAFAGARPGTPSADCTTSPGEASSAP
jgi:alkanesulfonate monooxygenase SsuD/methylene tetrahydromethanopterin reductase-like flavin-dependent oxidoreductase (luciferase family)